MPGMFDFNGNGSFDIFDAALLGAIWEDEEEQRRRRQQRDEMGEAFADEFESLGIDESDITDYIYDDDGEEIGFVYIDAHGHAQRHLYEDE